MNNIAIIGSGPTGIYTAHYLIERHAAQSITIFESQDEAGKGTPYHQDWNDKSMLSNIASIEIPPVTQTLVEWLSERSEMELAWLGIAAGTIDERAFYPRVVLGEYFKAQLAALVELASKYGCELRVKSRHQVLDVEVTDADLRVSVRGSDGVVCNLAFTHVVMATGHAWPKKTEIRPGYFLSPWPATALKTIGNYHVGIRGASLTAIDALVALATARGTFQRDMENELHYFTEPGTEGFHVTMMSRKGVIPEADFYYPIPYEPLQFYSEQAIERLVKNTPPAYLLDETFALFKQELEACDPEYAQKIRLAGLSLEVFYQSYFREREEADTFAWAQRNLAQARKNTQDTHTVPWRYAILRMQEPIARIVPHLLAEDYLRFGRYFKALFVDMYATVPHESIERLLALQRAGKLDVLKIGEDYTLDTHTPEGGATLSFDGKTQHFPAFIEATGQRQLSPHEFPFPTLFKQGIVHEATLHTRGMKPLRLRGIALDASFHPDSEIPMASRLYCLNLPFILGQYPFAQGITSSHDMGKTVAEAILQDGFSTDYGTMQTAVTA